MGAVSSYVGTRCSPWSIPLTAGSTWFLFATPLRAVPVKHISKRPRHAGVRWESARNADRVEGPCLSVTTSRVAGKRGPVLVKSRDIDRFMVRGKNMANKRHRTLVSLPELVDEGPILIRSLDDREGVRRIAELQATFGDNVRARIVPAKVDGHRVLQVVLRYTSYRAVAGELDADLARRLGSRIRWLALWNRVPGCDALIDNDPASAHYLDVWLNPVREGNVRQQSESFSS